MADRGKPEPQPQFLRHSVITDPPRLVHEGQHHRADTAGKLVAGQSWRAFKAQRVRHLVEIGPHFLFALVDDVVRTPWPTSE